MTIGTSATAHRSTIARKAGKIVNRKVTVSVSTIIRSMKFAVIIRTWYLSCESSTSTPIMTSESIAAAAGRRRSASQRKFNNPQASRNAAMAVSVVSVAAMMAKASKCGSKTKPARQSP